MTECPDEVARAVPEEGPARVPVPLEPPLRPFLPGDAGIAASLNDLASGGLVAGLWRMRAGPGGDPMQFGRQRQLERMAHGQTMVVVDRGHGVEAVMIGHPIGLDEGAQGEVPAAFEPILELEQETPGSWYLSVLATVPSARRRGHARRLLTVADRVARAEGYDEVSLIVYDTNVAALAMYRDHGFEERARRPMIVDASGAGPQGNAWLLLTKRLP